jgi:hypothetical protein
MAPRRVNSPSSAVARRRGHRPPATGQVPLLAVVGILEGFPRDWLVHLPHLQEHAAHRSVRRVLGTRDAAGGLVEPTLSTEVLDPGDWVRPAGFDVGHHSASLTLRVSRRVRLVDRLTGAAVPVVAGILLDRLRSYHSYALVADGLLAVETLTVRISSRRLFEALWKAGVLESEDGKPANDYHTGAAYLIRLDNLPLAAPVTGKLDLGGVFAELASLKVLLSLVAAHLRDESAEYTPEQVEELKEHYISKSLNLNFPTTNPYTNLKQALAEGTVGTRTGYRIDFGSADVLGLSKFRPANEFFARVYEVLGESERPAFENALNGDRTYRHKRLPPRTKLTKADEFARRLFDDFLGVAPNGSAVAVLEAVGANDLAAVVKQRARDKQSARRALVEALADAKKKLEARREQLSRDKLAPLVFAVGATGELPAGLAAKSLTADELLARYPELTLSKEERDGTFFVVGDLILAVYATTEYYSR